MSNEENSHQPDQHGQYGWQGHSEGPDSGYGGWEPTPQGDGFDADATAFVHLSPEDLADIPLAAPGHGYVPPMIVPLTPAAGLDPAATGSWVVQTQAQQAEAERRAREDAAAQEAGAVHWPDPNRQDGAPGGYRGPYENTSHATAQWNFTDALAEPPTAPAPEHHDVLDGPVHTDHAGHAGHTGHVDHAGHADDFGAVGHAGPVDYAGHAEDFGHAGNTGGAGRADHTGHVDHAAHADHAPHPDHADQAAPSAPADGFGHPGPIGPWAAPAADGALPDASGAYPAPAQPPSWYADSARPATLPGGAPAPWADQLPEPQPEPRTSPEPALEPEPAPVSASEPEADPVPAPEERSAPEAEPAADVRADEPAEPAEHPAAAASPTDTEDASAALLADAPGPETPEPSETSELSETAAEAEASAAGATTEETEPGADAAPDAYAGPAATPDTVPDPPEPEPEPEPGLETGPEHGAEAEAEAVLAQAPAPLDAPSDHPATSYVLHVNGVDRPVSDAWIGESLLYVLRERLGLAGAKDGCSQGECGACNVQVDGRLVASCLVPAATTAGSEVRTVEGLAVDGEPSDVQRALASCGAVQCGFCIPGMAMTVHDLLEGNHAPTELETRQALCGNLCRCSGYRGVLDAVADVVAAREAAAEAAAPEEARIPHQAEPGAGGVQQAPHPHEGEAL
ncbi:2Fe-2S iron-sulfur cluster-binding protein [Streptomyces sp. NPDC059698]|uniref:(2Fe-2S)-binding protein n=1 Tax=unclassified Streptomyces TaxID=2593676 RepID=UPI00093D37FC|nr:(2Fe-2S)-binding protein [Streptomyces sp. CB02366]OKJ39585.1 (2Fe-2S)-binding protein [Streptomyces sp. CB02366]